MDTKPSSTNSGEGQRAKGADKESEEEPNKGKETASKQDMALLFQLLLKEPSEGHDFTTCDICKQHGIARI